MGMGEPPPIPYSSGAQSSVGGDGVHDIGIAP